MSMQQGDSSIGQIIDGYRILEVLGKGGMGIVYKAEDIALSRAVAIKMIAPDLASNESFLRRFHSEARALARVESPFIVGVHALRQVEESFFIVMEYVDGWTLADEIEKGVIEFSRARVMLKQMLQAFSRAHSVGVIHRDIKPRNIMINKAGRVKVTDFGLAKLRQDDGKSTVTQGMAGTARYMSPEQVLGSTIDPRSDLYSLGMTMYEMLAGVLPFGIEEGTFSILKRIVEEELPSPLKYNPSIPPKLVHIIQRAIQKDPAQRFQSAQDMLEALEEAFKSPRESPATIAGVQPSQIHVAPQQFQEKTKLDGATKKKPFLIAALVAGLLLIYPVSQLISGSDPSDGVSPPTLAERPVENPVDGQIKLVDLIVSTIPAGATVVVDRVPMGVASSEGLTFEVPAGKVNMALELEGYQLLDTTITVTAEMLNRIELPLIAIAQAGLPEPVPAQNVSNGEENPDNNPDRPAVATGSVSLFASPGGVIYIDGSRYQDSITSLKLPAGRHQVRFEDPGTGAVKETTLNVRGGRSSSRTCYFQHKLNIQLKWADPGETSVPPYANIFINGKSEGPTPLADYKLSPGDYTVLLKRREFELSESQQLHIAPTFDEQETNHKLFFTIKKLP